MKNQKVDIRPQGLLGFFADMAMFPLMYLLQGNFRQLPQRTHFWNNQKFQKEDLLWLDESKMVKVPGDILSKAAWTWGLFPRFHVPIFGGWDQYVVLYPAVAFTPPWYVGWISGDACGVSQVPITNEVRVLRGTTACRFFAVAKDGRQIKIRASDYGEIGDGRWGFVPLL